MSWEIRIPFADRSESLVDVIGHMGDLPVEDRDVVREIVVSARLDGMHTAGELLDRLEAMEPHERRELLDAARGAVGLEPTSTVDARVPTMAITVSDDPGVQACHYPGCSQIPVTSYGAIRLVDSKRWHCPEHEAYAKSGDMDPPPPPWRYSPSGSIIPNIPEHPEGDDSITETRRAELEARDHENHEAAAEM